MVRSTGVDRNLGRVLGTYRLVCLLAEGGMGNVYEAEHTEGPGQRVAIKLLHPGAAADPASFTRFQREAQIASQLGHPNIVRVLGFDATDDGLPYMVMELLEGRDLGQLLARGALPRATAAEILDQIGSGLQAVHDAGVVHRNMKPQNVFLQKALEPRARVKLLDFGLSKISGNRGDLTRNNPIFGTPHYMAPELAEGRAGEVDHRADIFATAVIAYQCLTGKLPFNAGTPSGVLYQICNVEPPPASEVIADLPLPIDGVLSRGLAKRTADRYGRVADLVGDLCALLEPAPREDDVTRAIVVGAVRVPASNDVTPTVETELPTRVELTAPRPSSDDAVTRVELAPGDPFTAVEITPAIESLRAAVDATNPDLTPRLETVTPAAEPQNDLTPAPEEVPHASPDLAPLQTPRAAEPAPPRDVIDVTQEVRHPASSDRWLTQRRVVGLVAMVLLGVGITLALVIIRWGPAEEPHKVGAAPRPALDQPDAAAPAPAAPDAATTDDASGPDAAWPDLASRQVREVKRARHQRRARLLGRQRHPRRIGPSRPVPQQKPASKKKRDDDVRYDDL